MTLRVPRGSITQGLKNKLCLEVATAPLTVSTCACTLQTHTCMHTHTSVAAVLCAYAARLVTRVTGRPQEVLAALLAGQSGLCGAEPLLMAGGLWLQGPRLFPRSLEQALTAQAMCSSEAQLLLEAGHRRTCGMLLGHFWKTGVETSGRGQMYPWHQGD